MSRLTLRDRLAAAITGALFGGFVGFFLIFRSASYTGDLKHWVVSCALGFGFVGFSFGPFVASVIGALFGIRETSLYAASRKTELPTRWVIAILLCIIALVRWLAP